MSDPTTGHREEEASEDPAPTSDTVSLNVETNQTEPCIPKEPKKPPMASSSAPSYAALQQANKRDFILLNIERQAASVLLQGKGSIRTSFIRESRYSTDEKKFNLNEHLKRIMDYHEAGYRTLVIVRGLPGSGKTMLARLIVSMTVGLGSGDIKTHIFSPHQFFLDKNISYNDTTYAQAAREWNQLKAGTALSHGRSPVIIDDTHAQCWEMAPYVRSAVQNGYALVVIEPNTTFAKNPSELTKKNTHNVTLREITKMKNLYKENLFAEQIIKTLKLSYPSQLTPPVMRNDPPVPLSAVKVVVKQTAKPTRAEKSTVATSVETGDHSVKNSNFPVICTKPRNINISNVPPTESSTLDPEMVNKTTMTDDDFDEKLSSCKNDAKNFEAFNSFKDLFSNVPEVGLREIFNKCGENPNFVSELTQDPKNNSKSDSSRECDTYACDSGHSVVPELDTSTLPTMPNVVSNKGDEDIIGSLDELFCQMKWDMNYPESPNLFCFPETPEGREEVSRNMEVFDGPYAGETTHNMGVIGGPSTRGSGNIDAFVRPSTGEASRNVEEFGEYLTDEASRNMNIIGETFWGHATGAASQNVGVIGEPSTRGSGNIEAFSRTSTGEASRNVAAFEGPLSGEASRKIEIFGGPETGEGLPNMGVIDRTSTGGPSRNMEAFRVPSTDADSPYIGAFDGPSTGGAIRKFGAPGKSATNGAIRKTGVSGRSSSSESSRRMGAYGGPSTGGILRNMGPPDEPSIGGAIRKTRAFGETSGTASAHNILLRSNAALNRSNSNNNDSYDNIPEAVELHLDMDFIKQIDQICSGRDAIHPSYTVPKMTMPVSMVAKLYNSVLNSIDHQTQPQQEYREILEREDKQLAWKLMKEDMEMMEKAEKMSCREQMDMNLAQQLYDQEVKEFKNREPVDPGIQSKRDRLIKLFPDINPDVLHELLQAHDNTFVQTVESILMSTGRTDIVKKKNGVNIFIVEQERLKQDQVKEKKQTKELCRKECPVIVEELEVQMSIVTAHRTEAQRHMEAKNYCTMKLKECMRSRMAAASVYYIERIHFHRKMFNEESRFAAEAVTRVQVTAKKYNCIISLHNMFYGEAMDALETFLDHHIKMLEMIGSLGEKTLYVITGNEMHRPHDEHHTGKVMPAVKMRLRERAIPYSETPAEGLLTLTISSMKKVYFDKEDSLD